MLVTTELVIHPKGFKYNRGQKSVQSTGVSRHQTCQPTLPRMINIKELERQND